MPITYSPPLFTNHTNGNSTTVTTTVNATSINKNNFHSDADRKRGQMQRDTQCEYCKYCKNKSCKYVKLKNSAKKRNMRTTNFKKSIFSSVSSIFTSFLICVNFILICLLQKKLLLCTRPIAYITCFNRQGCCVIIFGAKGVLRFPNVRPIISKIVF